MRHRIVVSASEDFRPARSRINWALRCHDMRLPVNALREAAPAEYRALERNYTRYKRSVKASSAACALAAFKQSRDPVLFKE